MLAADFAGFDGGGIVGIVEGGVVAEAGNYILLTFVIVGFGGQLTIGLIFWVFTF